MRIMFSPLMLSWCRCLRTVSGRHYPSGVILPQAAAAQMSLPLHTSTNQESIGCCTDRLNQQQLKKGGVPHQHMMTRKGIIRESQAGLTPELGIEGTLAFNPIGPVSARPMARKREFRNCPSASGNWSNRMLQKSG